MTQPQDLQANSNLRELPEMLTVVALRDPLIEVHGHLPRSPYVEAAWGPILGPGSTMCFRRLGVLASISPEGISIDTADLAASLGLGAGRGRNSKIARTLGRLADFRAADWTSDGRYSVRVALPDLPERLVRRLPPTAQRFHQHALDTKRQARLKDVNPSELRCPDRRPIPTKQMRPPMVGDRRVAEPSGRSR